MITSKTFTIETRLNLRNNAEIIEYVREYSVLYGKMIRFTWHRIKNGGKLPMKKSDFNALLQKTFNVNKRAASSVICEVIGIYHALYQLRWTEFCQLRAKVANKQKKYKKLQNKVYVLKERAKINILSNKQLCYYHKLKTKLFYLSQDINHINRSIQNLSLSLKSHKLSMCFGSKKLFLAQYRLVENHITNHNAWYEAFCKHRDNRVLYIGSKDETCKNSLVQLTPMVNVGKGNSYTVQIRKHTKEKGYVYGSCNFNYMGGYLTKLIIGNKHGVSYRIIFRGKKCYLQAMIAVDRNCKDCKTRNVYGTIDLDYNSGFIEMAETNETGNLIRLKHINLKYHGTGNKAESEIQEKVSDIVNYAISVGKDIVIEDLNFKQTKAETEEAKSDKGKDYNKMIHLFDYSRYKSAFENCCYLRNVNLIKVNPAYTSKIAGQKYCNQRKLVIHQGASFVIARKGQGFVDKYINPKKKRLA